MPVTQFSISKNSKRFSLFYFGIGKIQILNFTNYQQSGLYLNKQDLSSSQLKKIKLKEFDHRTALTNKKNKKYLHWYLEIEEFLNS